MNKAIVLAILAASVALSGCNQMHRKTEKITVDSKERQCDAEGSGKTQRMRCYYVVFATDGRVYENTDSLVIGWRWKMDSASLQAKLKANQTYEIDTIGYRVPFFSWKPNIINARELRQ